MKTLICLILDRSGSMHGRETDVVGGVNRFIADQKLIPGEALIKLVRFQTGQVETFRPLVRLSLCEPLQPVEFQPAGGTPLLDAVGQTIMGLEHDWTFHHPDKCIVVVVTDGQENASREFSKHRIKDLIESREKSGMWTFIYLGANVDAFAEAGQMGFLHSNTAGYTSTAQGTQTAYAAASHSVGNIRKGFSHDANLGVGNLGENPEAWADSTAKTP